MACLLFCFLFLIFQQCIRNSHTASHNFWYAFQGESERGNTTVESEPSGKIWYFTFRILFYIDVSSVVKHVLKNVCLKFINANYLHNAI